MSSCRISSHNGAAALGIIRITENGVRPGRRPVPPAHRMPSLGVVIEGRLVVPRPGAIDAHIRLLRNDRPRAVLAQRAAREVIVPADHLGESVYVLFLDARAGKGAGAAFAAVLMRL